MPLVETKNIVIISVWERNSNKSLKHCSQVLNTYVVADTVVDSANPCYPISVQLEALTPSCTLEPHGGLFANKYWCPDLQNQNQNLREHDPGTKILKVPLPQSQVTPMKSPLRTNNQTKNPGCASQFWPVMGQGWEDGGEDASSPKWAPKRKLSLYVIPRPAAATPKMAEQRWKEYGFPNHTVQPLSQLALKSCLLFYFHNARDNRFSFCSSQTESGFLLPSNKSILANTQTPRNPH